MTATQLKPSVAFQLLKQLGCPVTSNNNEEVIVLSREHTPALFESLQRLGFRSQDNSTISISSSNGTSNRQEKAAIDRITRGKLDKFLDYSEPIEQPSSKPQHLNRKAVPLRPRPSTAPTAEPKQDEQQPKPTPADVDIDAVIARLAAIKAPPEIEPTWNAILKDHFKRKFRSPLEQRVYFQLLSVPKKREAAETAGESNIAKWGGMHLNRTLFTPEKFQQERPKSALAQPKPKPTRTPSEQAEIFARMAAPRNPAPQPPQPLRSVPKRKPREKPRMSPTEQKKSVERLSQWMSDFVRAKWEASQGHVQIPLHIIPPPEDYKAAEKLAEEMFWTLLAAKKKFPEEKFKWPDVQCSGGYRPALLPRTRQRAQLAVPDYLDKFDATGFDQPSEWLPVLKDQRDAILERVEVLNGERIIEA